MRPAARSRTTSGIVLLLLAAALLAATPAASAKVHLTIEVKEKDCGDGIWCFDVVEGSMSDIAPGEEIAITFRNTGGSAHQLDVTTKAHMDAAHETTSRDDNIANTTTNIEAGGEETISFTVPADAKGIYLFCGISGHEQLGMWLLADFEESKTEDAAESPGLGPLTALVLAGLAAAAFRRRL